MAIYGKLSYSPSTVVMLPISDEGAIAEGDMLVPDGNYFKAASSGEKPVAVALEPCSAPDSDGDYWIKCECNSEAIFRYPTDAAASISVALLMKTCDISGKQEIDIGASTDDVITIVGIDTTNDTVDVKIDFSAGTSGVA